MPEARYVPALRFRALTGLYDPVARVVREGEFKGGSSIRQRSSPATGSWTSPAGPGPSRSRRRPRSRRRSSPGSTAIRRCSLRPSARPAAEGAAVDFREGLSTELPYPDGTFDRVLSTLFFHHLDPDGKRRTLAEVLRVLRPGGELHIADWGKPSDPLMALLGWQVRLLDGRDVTDENFTGALPGVVEGAGFEDVAERDRLRTPLGSIVLLAARAPRA